MQGKCKSAKGREHLVKSHNKKKSWEFFFTVKTVREARVEVKFLSARTAGEARASRGVSELGKGMQDR